MDVRTFRARTMHDALRLVRNELGPQAAVLHTRELPRGLWTWFTGARDIEVTASVEVNVPSHLTDLRPPSRDADDSSDEVEPMEAEWRGEETAAAAQVRLPALGELGYRSRFRGARKEQLSSLDSLVEQLSRGREPSQRPELPDALFRLFTDLIDAELSEEFARELIDRIRGSASADDLNDLMLLKARLARFIEEEIRVTGPIEPAPGECRIVAMVGPTGVGKTTTIAKLAANQRLREHRRVGLITVDTYRIAAVEQLRTYADIMDLPMEVVATPREMRAAIQKFSDFDLVLMDTAGRSPRDEVRIQELKSLLHEAQPHEVHLVLSAVASLPQMQKAAEKFARVGVTSLLLTKLDEATGLGNLLPLVRSSRLPLSYITNGQNVPADIEPAERRKLARVVLGLEQIHV
ncbi:MAG: flagellar biosynthesis protein FlhF [Planctomycetes bacterium]|nr:flagellar biosynthesis protein FlhF [Planctomycetota bacterium]